MQNCSRRLVNARINYGRYMRICYKLRMRSIRNFEHAPLHTLQRAIVGKNFEISVKISGFDGFPRFHEDFGIS